MASPPDNKNRDKKRKPSVDYGIGSWRNPTLLLTHVCPSQSNERNHAGLLYGEEFPRSDMYNLQISKWDHEPQGCPCASHPIWAPGWLSPGWLSPGWGEIPGELTAIQLCKPGAPLARGDPAPQSCSRLHAQAFHRTSLHGGCPHHKGMNELIN